MILPFKSVHRPRMTLGQILASVAVSAVPIGAISGGVSGEESMSGLVILLMICACLALLAIGFFWVAVVPLVPPLERALGRPSWFSATLDVNPEGVRWVEAEPSPPKLGSRARPESEGISWLD